MTCAPPSASKVFVDPILTIEVLSPSNENETWETIRACATIPSLMEIAVVESESIGARVFRRDPKGAWPETPEVVEAGGVLGLTSIEAAFEMKEVYRGTHWRVWSSGEPSSQLSDGGLPDVRIPEPHGAIRAHVLQQRPSINSRASSE